MNDPMMNGAHARHYVTTAAGHHGAIVRLQEERDALRAENARLRGQLFHARAEIAYLSDRDAELELVVTGAPA